MRFSSDERDTIKRAAEQGFLFQARAKGIVVAAPANDLGPAFAWEFPHADEEPEVWHRIVAFVRDMVK